MPYDVFPASDGNITIACGNDGQFVRLCAALGDEDLAARPDYRRNRDRVINRLALTEQLHRLTRGLSRAELLQRLDEAGVPAGPINSMREVFADPQVVARGLKLDLPNPMAGAGATAGLRSPILIDGVASAAASGAPALGQHNLDVLADPRWGG